MKDSPTKKLEPEAKPRPARSRAWRIALGVMKWGAIAGLALAALGAASVAGLFWMWGSDPKLPRIAGFKDYRPKQVTKVLSADGKLIGEIFEERRTVVPLNRIAPVMVQAIIDAEDAQFREHEGLDFRGMVRALWVNVTSGETRQGASTITQQVVKTLMLTPERTLKRKVQEIVLARRLEDRLSKDEILTLYLNQIYFGHGRYGVEEAAQFYFGKSAAELNVGEAALLAGLPQSPERLSPHKHPEEAKARQAYVLRQMVVNGHLTEQEAKWWLDQPIKVLPPNHEAYLDVAPEVVEVVRKELVARYGEGELMRLGLVVRTTIDLDLQRSARRALEQGLAALDERQGYRGPIARLDDKKLQPRLDALAKELPPGGPKLGDTYEAVVLEVSDERGEMVVDLGGWKGRVKLGGRDDARYNPQTKKPSERFAPRDVVIVRRVRDDEVVLELGPQGAMVVIDPRTRHVVAIVGGYDYQYGRFNRALRAKRQPGSTFKPFVYAAALDSGRFTASSIVNDAPEVYDLWKPKNYEQGKFLGPVRLRTALARSINTVAIRVLHDVGPGAVVELARAMGIQDELPRELSLALGSGVVTPIDLVNAFATFAAEGVYTAPVFILSIREAGGAEQPMAPPATRQVLRPEVAFLVTSMMESVVQEGTASAAKKLKRRIAGKTGTSNAGRDAWFVGYTPDLVAGVWIGFDDMRKLGKGEAGARAALPVWMAFMQDALDGRGAKTFRRPPGLVVARIDKRTGKLAPADAHDADVLEEVFLEGTEPTEVAPSADEIAPEDWTLQQMEAD